MGANRISGQLRNFGGHRQCGGGGDIMFLICHVVKQGFLNSINREAETGNFAGRNFLIEWW